MTFFHTPSVSSRWLAVAIPLGSLALVLLATWLAYYPGLGGGFQFDDFANLPAIGATGPVDDWATFWRYITSGHADPTGRPVAMLSFLIDARNWPASPWPFLRTSIILHLINGVLLFVLLRALGRAFVGAAVVGAGHARDGSALQPEPARERSRPTAAPTRWRVEMAALVGAGLWLLHPLLVSTTLYIVQREAMLAATFVLLGLLLWLHGRARLLGGHTVAGVVWMVLGLGGCTLLALLSKANGVLLPALALTIEYTVLRHGVGRRLGEIGVKPIPTPAVPLKGRGQDGPALSLKGWEQDGVALPLEGREQGGAKLSAGAMEQDGAALASEVRGRRRYRVALAILAWLPALVVAAYLVYVGWQGFAHGTGRRPWSLGQRLLTEPRVLVDYLHLLWAPRPFTPGLFNDQIHASASLFAPWTTLPCLLLVVGLIVGALVMRKQWPAWALAVLFYFVGQALESSTVALELYFEHRNYLPAVMMFWPLALWLCGVRQRTRCALVGAGHARDRSRDEWSGEAERSRAWPAPTNVAKAFLAVLLLVGLGVMTHARASVWGNTHEQALLWAKLNPDSPRAQANAALAQMHAGHPQRAAARLRGLLAQKPDQVQLALNLFAAECSLGHVPATTMQAAETALATTANPGSLIEHWFTTAINQTAHPACPQLALDTLGRLLAAMQSNAKLMAIGGRHQDLLILKARIALKRKQPDQALSDFKRALDQNVRTSAALAMAAQLGLHGYPERGLALLHYYDTQARSHAVTPGFGMPRVHAWVLHREHYWQHELAYLRNTLRKDAASKR